MALARWTLLSRNSTLARSSHCLAVTSAGSAHLYGGELKPRTPVDGDGSLKGSVHIFDVYQANVKGAGRWQTVAAAAGPIPEPRVGAATTILGDHLYLWGGRGGVDMAPLPLEQAGLWRYSFLDASQTKWERFVAANEGLAPQPRSYHAITSCADKLFIHAGCPASGRTNELHSFDPATKSWKALTSAPEPGRGGTVLAPARLQQQNVLLRFAGFAGHELGADHTLDIYDVAADTWRTTTPAPDTEHGFPGARSVHGFVAFTSATHPSAVALLYHGERDASTLGHAGAGTFWSDVWMLVDEGDGLAWRYVPVEGEAPEARGWFPTASYVDSEGNTKVVLQGGLLSSNDRSDELWLLEIE